MMTSGHPPKTQILLIVAGVAIAWIPIVVLSSPAFSSDGRVDPLLLRTEPHVRMLCTLTLLLFAERALDRRVGMVEQGISTNGMLPHTRCEQWAVMVERLRWLRNDKIVQLCWMAVVYGALLLAYFDLFPDRVLRWMLSTLHGVDWADTTLAWWWYVLVAQPLLLLFIGRFIYRWVLWGVLLWRLSRWQVDLHPSDGDQAGGLGFTRLPLEALQMFVFAAGLAIACVWFDEIAAGRARSSTFSVDLLVFLALSLTMMLLPYLPFTPHMVHARDCGLVGYSELMHRYAAAFERRWFDRSQQSPELLGHPDISALADLRSVTSSVEKMRVVIPSFDDFKSLLITAVLPFLLAVLAQGTATVQLIRNTVLRFIGA